MASIYGMTIEEIRKNRPEGATHYTVVLGKAIYCKIISKQLYGHANSIGWYKFYSNIPIKPL